MKINFLLKSRRNKATGQYDPEMYTNVTQNIYRNIDSDRTLEDDLAAMEAAIESTGGAAGPSSLLLTDGSSVEDSIAALKQVAAGLDKVDNTADKDKNVASAAKLATARKIDGISFNGEQDVTIPRYGTCTTAAATAAKVGTLSGFVLITGAIVGLTFTNANTATSPTLNVNSTGAKPVYCGGKYIAEGMITAGMLALLQYNGSQWVLLNPASPLAATTTDWQLLTEYKAAGTYTWTAPDVYGDSLPYEIGVFIIGGGGSGGVVVHRMTPQDSSYVGGLVGGGASGYTRVASMEVVPGFSYALVVGAGGAPVVYELASTTQSPSVARYGANGESSSFFGIVARGGSGATGGKVSDSAYLSGASGGQASDTLRVNTAVGFLSNAAAMGQLTSDYIQSGSVMVSKAETNPTMSFNPFNLKRYLSVGGAGFMGGITKIAIQEVPTLDDGLRAGRSSVVSSRVDVTGESATSPGSGGGGALLGTNSTSGQAILTSGAGADGAVMIYVRRPVR